MKLSKSLLSTLTVMALSIGHAEASHLSTFGSIDEIDFVFASGGGTASGSLSSGTDDDWLVFAANAGDALTITATAPQFKNMVLLQDTGDGVFTVGDLLGVSNFNTNHVGDGNDLKILAHIGPLEFAGTQTLNFTAGFTGQYGIGITAANDSNSFAGAWTITLAGNTADVTGVPEPTSLALLGLGLAGVGFTRKKKNS